MKDQNPPTNLSLSVSKTCPIVVVSCLRDMKLLELQAYSINQWLNDPHDIYIIVNEDELIDQWNEYFDTHCRKYYHPKHNLTILYKNEFDCHWRKRVDEGYLHNGWDNQQILKLAISQKLNSHCYLVLDSKDFLIKLWSTNNYSLDDKIPGRKNLYSMNTATWVEYSKALSLPVDLPTRPVMTIATPVYLKSDLVQSLISNFGGLKDFSFWFLDQDCSLSEFVLYYLWAEKNGGYDSFHNDVGSVNPWNGPMMRLARKKIRKNQKFSFFINHISNKKNEAWLSITHESWSLMNPDELKMLSQYLKNYKIDTNLIKKLTT